MQAHPVRNDRPILWSVVATLILLLALLWIVPFSGAGPVTASQIEEPTLAPAAEVTAPEPETPAMGQIVGVATPDE